MSTYDRELAAANLHWHLKEVREMCRKQRVTLLFEREQVRLCHELRHTIARLQLRRSFRREIDEKMEAVVRPLVESVGKG
jgi:hypothetical protein